MSVRSDLAGLLLAAALIAGALLLLSWRAEAQSEPGISVAFTHPGDGPGGEIRSYVVAHGDARIVFTAETVPPDAAGVRRAVLAAPREPLGSFVAACLEPDGEECSRWSNGFWRRGGFAGALTLPCDVADWTGEGIVGGPDYGRLLACWAPGEAPPPGCARAAGPTLEYQAMLQWWQARCPEH